MKYHMATILLLALIGCRNSQAPNSGDEDSRHVGQADHSTITEALRITPWNDRRMRKESLPIINALVLSPDGSLLAWGDTEGNILLYQIEQQYLVVVNNNTVTSQGPVDDAFLPTVEWIRFRDNNTLVWSVTGGDLYQVSIKEGRAGVKTLINPGHEVAIGLTCITQNKHIVCEAAQSLGGILLRKFQLEMYDIDTALHEKSCAIYPPGRGYHWINAMALSADDSLLAIASENNSGVVNMASFQLVKTFGVPWGLALAISPDKTQVAISTKSGKIVVIDVVSGERRIEIDLGIGNGYGLLFYNNNTLWYEHGDDVEALYISSGERTTVVKRIEPTVIAVDHQRQIAYLGSRRDASVVVCKIERPGFFPSIGREGAAGTERRPSR